MIITCVKCSKKFNLDDNLIPEEGRELQCGSCNHKWFFRKEVKSIKLENEIPQNKSKENDILDNFIDTEESNTKVEKKIEVSSIKVKNGPRTKKIKTNPKIVKKSLVFIISVVALIILLDTFKFQLNSYFPGLDSLLNNLYESLKDLSLFFKDLIN
tara:strand:- start:72 stop:539 length:468 start_codon:yes stop_codon:yes gene_type:complete